jgi:hypothetical protein
MKNFKFRYKSKYDNSFVSTLILFFVTFFVGLWLYFFVNPLLTLIGFGLVILYLIYWNFNTDGKLKIQENGGKQTISISGKIQLSAPIEKFYFGWNYAFINHGKSISLNPLMPVVSDDTSRPTSNTNQCIVLLKLKNGQHIVLIKELLPWQETRDLEYIGHLTDTLVTEHNLYIKGNFWRFRESFNV